MRFRLLVSRPAVFAKCRLPLPYLHFLLSLYSDLTFSFRTRRDGTYQELWSGSAPLQGSIGDALRNSTSIVQRLNHRAITGRALGITVHQQHGYRMHYGWNGAFGNRCFKRRFPSYHPLSHFCITMIIGAPVVLCS